MEILISTLIFIASVLALAKGSSVFVDSAVKIAKWLNIPISHIVDKDYDKIGFLNFFLPFAGSKN